MTGSSRHDMRHKGSRDSRFKANGTSFTDGSLTHRHDGITTSSRKPTIRSLMAILTVYYIARLGHPTPAGVLVSAPEAPSRVNMSQFSRVSSLLPATVRRIENIIRDSKTVIAVPLIPVLTLLFAGPLKE